MDVCKCIRPLQHGGTLKSRRAAKSSRVIGGRGIEVGGPWPPPGFSPSKLGWNRANRTVTCMVLKDKANNRHKNSSLYPR
ncbi:hypothetical protein TNCV_4547441 [Trichonephila clavipes]|nr:hypothetical protein TNCV_4547441 [Trichonephila clavipes]